MGDGRGPLSKSDVLQALAGARLSDGRTALAGGHIQDVLIEWHGSRPHVAVVVDEQWSGEAPPEQDLQRLREAAGKLPGVASVHTALRPEVGSRRGDRPRGAMPKPRAPKVPEGAKMLAVSSGKGGVGKSTVSVNLAVALAAAGQRVALLDCDIYGFSVPLLIGVTRPPKVVERRLVPPQAHGVQVMSMDFFVSGNQAVAWRGPMLGKALRQFVEDVRWTAPDVMVLDLPPGTGDMALDVAGFFPGAAQLVVTTPDPFAARVAERAGHMALQVGHTLLGIVENMAYGHCEHCGEKSHPFGQGGGSIAAKALGVEVLARIPFEAPDPGRRDGLVDRGAESWRAYAALADRVLKHLRGASRAPALQAAETKDGKGHEPHA